MRHYPANSALDGFPFMDYIPNRSFPVEGRAHEASLVRGKVRRLLPRLAIAAPGRHGTPPPATPSRREELADGEAMRVACPHEKRGPGREIAELVCANGAGSFAG